MKKITSEEINAALKDLFEKRAQSDFLDRTNQSNLIGSGWGLLDRNQDDWGGDAFGFQRGDMFRTPDTDRPAALSMPSPEEAARRIGMSPRGERGRPQSQPSQEEDPAQPQPTSPEEDHESDPIQEQEGRFRALTPREQKSRSQQLRAQRARWRQGAIPVAETPDLRALSARRHELARELATTPGMPFARRAETVGAIKDLEDKGHDLDEIELSDIAHQVGQGRGYPDSYRPKTLEDHKDDIEQEEEEWEEELQEEADALAASLGIDPDEGGTYGEDVDALDRYDEGISERFEDVIVPNLEEEYNLDLNPNDLWQYAEDIGENPRTMRNTDWETLVEDMIRQPTGDDIEGAML